MLTVQACQQHRLAVMHPNKAKSFPAATVPVVAKLGHRRRGKHGTRSEERRNARREHGSEQKCRRWRSRGVMGVPHPTRRKNEGKNLGRKYLKLSEGEGHFLGKSNGGSGRRGSSPETQGGQGEVSAGGAYVRHVQRSHSNGQRRQRYRPHRHPAENLCCKGLRRHRIAGDRKGRNFRNFVIWIPRLF